LWQAEPLLDDYKAAVDRLLLISGHVVTPTDTNATIALQHRNGVFYAVRAEKLPAAVSEESVGE
jgi:hypothetical protein